MNEVMSKPYKYTGCGLDNVWLIGGVEHVKSHRGESLMIKDIEGLHKAIGSILVREKKRLNGKEFRFLRHEINATQQVIASLLDVDVQTVARWEKAQTAMPGPAQRLIRLLYEEKINGNSEICASLEKLAELDEVIGGEEEITLQETPEGWSEAA